MHSLIVWLCHSAIPRQAGVTLASPATSILLGLCVTGCAMVPPDMLPDSSHAIPARKPAIFAGQTLLVAPVTGIGTSNLRVIWGEMGVPGTAVISGQTFHEALCKALRNSSLFGEVTPTGTTRYVLLADIVQQSTLGSGATFKVHYVLSDTQSNGRAIWNRDLEAIYVFRPDLLTFLSPYQTQFTALLRASGQNITLLIQNLASLPDPVVAP
jgi:hypothetical protein